MKRIFTIVFALTVIGGAVSQAEDIIVDDFVSGTISDDARIRYNQIGLGWYKRDVSEWAISGGVLTNPGTVIADISSEGCVGQVVSTAGLTAGNVMLEVSFDYTLGAGATLFFELAGLTVNGSPSANEILANTGTSGGNIQGDKANADFAAMNLIDGTGELTSTPTLSLTGSGTYTKVIDLIAYSWPAGEDPITGSITDVKDFELIVAIFASDLTTAGTAVTIDNLSITAVPPAAPTVSLIGITK